MILSSATKEQNWHCSSCCALEAMDAAVSVRLLLLRRTVRPSCPVQPVPSSVSGDNDFCETCQITRTENSTVITAVTAHLKSKQLLLFVYAQRHRLVIILMNIFSYHGYGVDKFNG